MSVFYVETILRTFIPTKETYTRFFKIHLKTKVQLVAELNAVLDDLLNIQCRLKYFEKRLTVSESLSVGSILQTF